MSYLHVTKAADLPDCGSPYMKKLLGNVLVGCKDILVAVPNEGYSFTSAAYYHVSDPYTRMGTVGLYGTRKTKRDGHAPQYGIENRGIDKQSRRRHNYHPHLYKSVDVAQIVRKLNATRDKAMPTHEVELPRVKEAIYQMRHAVLDKLVGLTLQNAEYANMLAVGYKPVTSHITTDLKTYEKYAGEVAEMRAYTPRVAWVFHNQQTGSFEVTSAASDSHPQVYATREALPDELQFRMALLDIEDANFEDNLRAYKDVGCRVTPIRYALFV